MLSIITPVLNGAQFIEKNVNSVRNLSIPHEHIIVDGGSTDGTLEIIRNYSNIKLLRQSKKNGMYGAIHEGINASSGQYIVWLNADDYFLPGIEKIYLKAKDVNADLAYGNALHHYLMENKTRKFYAATSGKYFLKKGMFPFCQSSSLFSREIYDQVSGFDYDNFKVCGDLDLYQKIAFEQGVSVIFVPVFASVFLKYPHSLGASNAALYKEEYKKLKVYQGDKLSVRIPYRASRLFSQIFAS